MTEKIYLGDSRLLSFEADAVDVRKGDGMSYVRLNKTCFYPTSGGQPCDTGTISGRQVTDVFIESGDIVHAVAGDVAQGKVRCEVDAARRLDHMQQHTGQHILSQAICRLMHTGTESLHIGASASTIDILVQALSEADVRKIEHDANAIVFSDAPIRTYEVQELDGSCRKSSSREGPLRIVEIGGFDKTPCGGTHCQRTGEVGLIKITDYFKKGKLWRIEFVCGGRALARMQQDGNTLGTLTALLNVPRKDVPAKISALLSSIKDTERACDALRGTIAASEVSACITTAHRSRGQAVCSAIVEDGAIAQKMGKLISGMSQVVCVIGAPTGKGPQIIVAAAADSGCSAKDIIGPALDVLGGKGGGSAQYASGKGTDNGLLEEAVACAYRRAVEG